MRGNVHTKYSQKPLDHFEQYFRDAFKTTS